MASDILSPLKCYYGDDTMVYKVEYLISQDRSVDADMVEINVDRHVKNLRHQSHPPLELQSGPRNVWLDELEYDMAESAFYCWLLT
jgi:hypothetical protein